MKTIDNIMYHIAGHGVIEYLADTLRENEPDFVESEKQFFAAVETLRRELPADMKPTLDEFLSAHETDIISRVTYAGYLGYRVNLENFHHPVRVDFISEDTIDYVKDHIIGHFPVNDSSAGIFDTFCKAAPKELKPLHDAIDRYFIHMECSGPKLAHYAGYVIANHFLPWAEPGYIADPYQTAAFAAKTKKFFKFLPI